MRNFTFVHACSWIWILMCSKVLIWLMSFCYSINYTTLWQILNKCKLSINTTYLYFVWFSQNNLDNQKCFWIIWQKFLYQFNLWLMNLMNNSINYTVGIRSFNWLIILSMVWSWCRTIFFIFINFFYDIHLTFFLCFL